MKTIVILMLLTAILLPASPAHAQTPAQMEYERQQREYWRAQEQQRQEQQRQQQLMQENARRTQGQGMPNNAAGTPQSQGPGSPTSAGGVPGGAAGANLERARQDWLRRPALAAAQNPLLGAWTRPQARASNDPFAQLGAMMKGGLCEVFFSGDAVFEFRPGALVGIDKRTHRADPLDQVEYRGGGKQVVVIPKATLKLIVFDFDGPDRIRWAGQNCTLTRVGAASAAAKGAQR